MLVPASFSSRMVELHGRAGEDWLAQLPTLVEECAQRWSLTVFAPFEPLSYNVVAPAQQADGTEVVLKLGVPNPELRTEIEALRIFAGRASVRLLEADAERGTLLLERLRPGTPLSCLSDDEEATGIAIAVMRRLWRPAPTEHSFPTIGRWAAGLQRLRARFDGGCGPFPARLVEMAEARFAELLDSMGELVLLHGDLHHENILTAEREAWLALDPKGVIGEREVEVGALLRNPRPRITQEPGLRQILARRVDQLVEGLGFERERVLSWAMAQAVLSAWWIVEDHERGWEMEMVLAELFAELEG